MLPVVLLVYTLLTIEGDYVQGLIPIEEGKAHCEYIVATFYNDEAASKKAEAVIKEKVIRTRSNHIASECFTIDQGFTGNFVRTKNVQ